MVQRKGGDVMAATDSTEVLRELLDRMRDELHECHETILINIGFRQEDGWIDTCAMADAEYSGEWLAENGYYERSEGKGGRRCMYRKRKA